MFDERNIGKLSCLWEAIHSFADFDKDYILKKEVFNLILINAILGENPSWQPHVFIFVHISVKVKVLDVQAWEFRKVGADNTVEY